jgi:high-affinity iron transporter
MFTSFRWLRPALALACAALAAFVVVTALGLGASGSRPATSRVPLAAYVEFAPHVASQLVILGYEGGKRGASLAPPPGDKPLPISDFDRPVAEYLAYAATQLRLMAGPLRSLEASLSKNDRNQAKRAWEAAYARYLHLGAVYLEGPIAVLNQRIDGSPGGLPGGTASPRFTGLHRIEYGLWTGAPPDSLLGWARQLSANVEELRALLPHVSISPLDYATRAHEILEDAVRDLLSGADVPWSQQGVLGTAAGLAATEEVVGTLRPLIDMSIVDTELAHLSGVMEGLAAAHGGTLPSNTELSQKQSEALDAAVGEALEALSQVPGSLETTKLPVTPTIPARDVVIDP